MFLDWFFYFFSVGQQSHVSCRLMKRLSDPTERVEDLRVHFAWVGLPSHAVSFFESKFFRNFLLQLFYFFLVAAKEL